MNIQSCFRLVESRNIYVYITLHLLERVDYRFYLGLLFIGDDIQIFLLTETFYLLDNVPRKLLPIRMFHLLMKVYCIFVYIG